MRTDTRTRQNTSQRAQQKRVDCWLENDIAAALEVHKQATNTSKTDIINEALRRYLAIQHAEIIEKPAFPIIQHLLRAELDRQSEHLLTEIQQEQTTALRASENRLVNRILPMVARVGHQAYYSYHMLLCLFDILPEFGATFTEHYEEKAAPAASRYLFKKLKTPEDESTK
jgi:hypothetical protein